MRKYNEMTQQVMDEMGITQADLDDQTDEGYALLEEFINKVSERGGAYQKYIKDIEIRILLICIWISRR